MEISQSVLGQDVYAGIDINLTGNALTIITKKQILMHWIPVVRQGLPLDEMTFQWYSTAESTWGKLEKAALRSNNVYMAIEDPTGMEQKAWQASAMINKMIGLLCGYFYDNLIEIKFPSSVIWKKRTIGNGKADKATIQRQMHEILFPNSPGRIENHHVADSAALAYYMYLEVNKDAD